MRTLRRIGAVAALGGVLACAAAAASDNWAAPQIRAVTQNGILGRSPATFAPQSALTQGALATAIRATDALQHPPVPPQPKPAPVTLATTVGPGAVVAGAVTAELDVTADSRAVDHVDFAVDGTGVHTEYDAPYSLDLDTTSLPDGVHDLAADVVFTGGGYVIATWQITVANAPGAGLTPLGSPVPLPIAKSWLPGPAPDTAGDSQADAPAFTPTLYRAASPGKAVTVKQLDAALVAYLGLGKAAREIQDTLKRAGLNPPANTGTEAVARLLGLRLNHPAGEDYLELLPNAPVTRAEAAYSFAGVLRLDSWAVAAVQQAADAFTLPTYSAWQRRILTTAVHYVGYPYVWGGTSPGSETDFGVHAPGGFDCSGFVWRVYKLTAYAGERNLSSVLRGRTTYQMSGEVPRSKLIKAKDLQPADVMFFGAKGPRSSPSVVDHTALYLGNGWFIQSSGEGVTLLPFGGWYTHSYAWGRRPLREAGLAG
ncbi:MAG TPA: NlpC/P60 family protein [Gaiellaceae bacterium]|nr:NlpC/P60 family protein [Gaiellaceae bacterium]